MCKFRIPDVHWENYDRETADIQIFKWEEIMKWFSQRTRKVHMDFHTPEFPADAIKRFDAGEFISTLKQANINVAVFFTKCHHGNAYYDATVGHKHSGMSGDMFGEQIAEARRQDIKVIAYYSVGWDERAAKEHPDWGFVGKDGKPAYWTHWQWLCVNTPYVSELILPQLKEVIEKYRPDGLWLDILSGGCYCKVCQKKYQAMYGKNLLTDDSDYVDFVNKSKMEFLKRVSQMAKPLDKDIMISGNGVGDFGSTRESVEYADYLTIESGYAPEPGEGALDTLLKCKYAQNFDKTLEICTTRFTHSWAAWGDLKPLNHMKLQFAEAIANGAVINCGDQAYPDGTLEKAAYQAIGKAFEFVLQREKYCIGARSIPFIAVLSNELNDTVKGIAKVLVEKGWHFDVINDEQAGRLNEYRLVIVAGQRQIRPQMLESLKEYVRDGGSLLASDGAGLKNGADAGDLLGVEIVSPSRYSVGYLRISQTISANCPDMPMVLRDRFLEVKPLPGTEVLSGWTYPLVEVGDAFRISHKYAPPGEKSPNPAITMNKFGKGQVVYVAAPLFASFWQFNHWHLKEVAHNILNLLVPSPLVRIVAPSSVEIALMQQDKRVILHLINYAASRASKEKIVVEDIPQIRDIQVFFDSSLRKKRALFMPGNHELKIREEKNCFSVIVPVLDIHGMIVLE